MSTFLRRVLPYPFVTFALTVMWLLLQQSLATGHLLLALAIGLGGARLLKILEIPASPFRRPLSAARFVGLLLVDVTRSNITVARLILSRKIEAHHADFITLDLTLRNPYALTCLALAITAAPGTLWVKYDSQAQILTIHMLDTIGREAWIANIKEDYEPLLREIFE